MQWTRLSPYCIQSGTYTVAKVSTGRWWYVAWRLKEMLGVFETAEEAKRVCESQEVKCA